MGTGITYEYSTLSIFLLTVFYVRCHSLLTWPTSTVYFRIKSVDGRVVCIYSLAAQAASLKYKQWSLNNSHLEQNNRDFLFELDGYSCAYEHIRFGAV